VGSSLVEEIPVNETYRRWAEEASKICGGLDILTVDAIQLSDGREVIIELNDSASGFLPKNAAEDMTHVRDLVLAKWEALLTPKEEDKETRAD